jgi:hypothetical protein
VQFYHGVRAVRPAVYAVLFLEHRSVFCLGGGDRREDISIISVKENQREEEEDKRGGASPRSFATRTREHLFNSRFIALRVSCCVVNDSFARVLQMWMQWAINPLHGREIGFNALNKFLSKSLPWEETLLLHITLYHHVSA